MTYKKTIFIPKKELKEINKYLNTPGLQNPNVIITNTVDFGNRIQADITLCNDGDDSFASGTLFKNNSPITTTEPDYKSYLGEYYFWLGDNEFIVIIKKEKK